LRVSQKWSPNTVEDLRRATGLIAAAEDINPNRALSLAIDGNIHTVLKADFSTAKQRFDAAQDINPSSAMKSHLASVLETFCDNGPEAVRLTERGYALSPCDPREPFFQTLSAGSYVAGGQYGKAVEIAEASLRRNPRHLSAHRCRVLGLQLGSRDAEARSAARDLLKIDPGLTVDGYLKHHPAGQSDLGCKLGQALKEAGIPVH
jgi:tetratricopeptide (TPR) repeat protein